MLEVSRQGTHNQWEKQMKLTVDVCLRALLARSRPSLQSACQHNIERRLLYYTFNYQALRMTSAIAYLYLPAEASSQSDKREEGGGGFLTGRHKHTLTFLITYPVCIYVCIYVHLTYVYVLCTYICMGTYTHTHSICTYKYNAFAAKHKTHTFTLGHDV